MRERIAGTLGGSIFSVVIPVVVSATMPHIEPGIGWPLVGSSVIVGVTIFLWGFTPHHLKKWRAKLGPLSIMALGLTLYASGALWYYLAHTGILSNKAAAEKTDIYKLYASVVLECYMSSLPTAVPAEGIVRTVATWPPFAGGGYVFGLTERPGTPGQKLQWSIPGQKTPIAHLCKITNYSNLPIFRLKAGRLS
ncbi:MAG: hypothetical protein JWL84_3235 [Rhodospirillales bacterium]|jgi:hypothetical protein|nr:hypothetical protein [Rhodospirillales bacterium]